MAKTYFTNLADIDLAKDAVAKTPDVYIQYYEYIGSGVYANASSGTSTLTPATSPAWSAGEMNSTVAKNLLVVDDNSVVAAAKVTSTGPTYVEFDETACLLESDATTAASFTVGSTYDFYVLTPSNTNAYGPFFGFCEGMELSITDDMMQYKYSRPRQLKFQDLNERTGQITGGHVNVDNEDVISSVFGSATYGSQTNQYAHGIGSNPDTDKFYRLTFDTDDRNGRDLLVIVRKVQLALNGNLWSNSESGHYMVPFTANIVADGFYPNTADMIQIIRAS